MNCHQCILYNPRSLSVLNRGRHYAWSVSTTLPACAFLWHFLFFHDFETIICLFSPHDNQIICRILSVILMTLMTSRDPQFHLRTEDRVRSVTADLRSRWRSHPLLWHRVMAIQKQTVWRTSAPRGDCGTAHGVTTAAIWIYHWGTAHSVASAVCREKNMRMVNSIAEHGCILQGEKRLHTTNGARIKQSRCVLFRVKETREWRTVQQTFCELCRAKNENGAR